MKSIILARVSSKEQSDTGYSLSSQEKLLREYADTNMFEVSKVFQITESASGYKQRKTFEEMMAYLITKNIPILIVEKTDRLTRNIRDAVIVNNWIEEDEERHVHFVKENFVLHKNSKSNEKFIWNIKVSVAQYYLDNLSEEVKKGQKEKISQGWLPTKPPTGYKTVGETGHKIHVIDEAKAPLVKKMFELYASKEYSLDSLTKVMAKKGLRNDNGHTIVKSRIDRLISDPFYIGKIKWNGQITDGKHIPLIPLDIFDLCQSVKLRKSAPKYGKHFYLFQGMMRCAGCGGQITWEEKKHIMYGHCNHYRNCDRIAWSHEKVLEAKLIEAMQNLEIKYPRFLGWIRKALKESHDDEIKYKTATVNEFQVRLDQIQKRLDNLYEDKLDEKITQDLYDRKSKGYNEERSAILSQIGQYDRAETKYFDLSLKVYDLSQKAKEIYLKAAPVKKRELIRLIFENLVVTNKDQLEFRYTKPFEFLYKAIKATNSSSVAKNEGLSQEKSEPTTIPNNSNENTILGTQCPTLLPR